MDDFVGQSTEDSRNIFVSHTIFFVFVAMMMCADQMTNTRLHDSINTHHHLIASTTHFSDGVRCGEVRRILGVRLRVHGV